MGKMKPMINNKMHECEHALVILRARTGPSKPNQAQFVRP